MQAEKVQNVQAVLVVQTVSHASILPYDVGEETGGGLIELNFLNGLNEPAGLSVPGVEPILQRVADQVQR